MQIGLVPSIFSRPCHGATSGVALHITMPINPAADSFCAHHAARAEMSRVARDHHAEPAVIAQAESRDRSRYQRSPGRCRSRRRRPCTRRFRSRRGRRDGCRRLPARICSVYQIRSWTPCESTPRRLAATSESATSAGVAAGTPDGFENVAREGGKRTMSESRRSRRA